MTDAEIIGSHEYNLVRTAVGMGIFSGSLLTSGVFLIVFQMYIPLAVILLMGSITIAGLAFIKGGSIFFPEREGDDGSADDRQS